MVRNPVNETEEREQKGEWEGKLLEESLAPVKGWIKSSFEVLETE